MPSSAARIAAAVAAALLGVVVAFQIALVLGAPWGALTQGGTVDGALPPAGRGAAAVSAVVLVLLALGLLGRVGRGPLARHRRTSTVLAWVAAGYGAVAVLLNAATPSAAERAVWLPVSGALLALALTTLLGSRRRAAGAVPRRSTRSGRPS